MFDAHNIALSATETLLLNAAILGIIVFALLKAERKLDESSSWIMLGILAMFAISGRILFEPLPNIQPVTVIVLLAGIYFGAPRAFALAGIVALLSNLLVVGHGPWTLFQVIGWGGVGITGALLSDWLQTDQKLNVNRIALVAFISGFAFNWIVSLSILIQTDISVLLPYIFNGLLYDFYHAAGNLAFAAWMAVPLGDLMHRHRITPNENAVSRVVTN